MHEDIKACHMEFYYAGHAGRSGARRGFQEDKLIKPKLQASGRGLSPISPPDTRNRFATRLAIGACIRGSQHCIGFAISSLDVVRSVGRDQACNSCSLAFIFGNVSSLASEASEKSGNEILASLRMGLWLTDCINHHVYKLLVNNSVMI